MQLDGPVDRGHLGPRFVERGVCVRPFGDVVHLMPPFVIGPDDLGRLIGAVADVVGD